MDFLFAEIWNIALYLQFYFLKLTIEVFVLYNGFEDFTWIMKKTLMIYKTRHFISLD